MLQGERPQDYILSSGELHSIKEFIDVCAEILQIKDWHEHVEINCNITNRNNGTQLFGNPKKIETELGWKKEIGFKEWISEMIMEEMR